ncbi:MAG: thiopurine S-methyltransferase [Balneolales bacterium]
METNYWLSRWKKGMTGFHATEVNDHLQKYWPALELPRGSTVLVPLCGRSLDLLWLAGQGHYVVGVELSEIACKRFFEEAELAYEITNQENFILYRSGLIEIWCGDFFKIRPKVFPPLDAVYDRAALVAMPPRLRQPYVQKISELANRPFKMLLISYTYPQESMSGPPFSVPAHEIELLYGEDCTLSELGSISVLEKSEKYRNKGLTGFREISYLIKTKYDVIT